MARDDSVAPMRARLRLLGRRTLATALCGTIGHGVAGVLDLLSLLVREALTRLRERAPGR